LSERGVTIKRRYSPSERMRYEGVKPHVRDRRTGGMTEVPNTPTKLPSQKRARRRKPIGSSERDFRTRAHTARVENCPTKRMTGWELPCQTLRPTGGRKTRWMSHDTAPPRTGSAGVRRIDVYISSPPTVDNEVGSRPRVEDGLRTTSSALLCVPRKV
jgi:hypothetical protein